MRSAIRSLYLGCMLWCCLSVSAAEVRQNASREVKRLLYVTSYNASYKWTNDVITGFREYFQHVNYPVKIDVIELDVLRTPDLLPSPRDISATIRSLKTGNYDLVVAADNCAVELIQEHHRDISGQLPFVFCGYVHWQPLRRNANANLTGLEQPDNILPNVKLGLRLLPATRQIAIITDGSMTGRAIHRNLPRLLREIQGVEFLYLHGDDYTDEQLLQKIAGLPPDSFIIFTNWRSSLEGNPVPLRQINDKIFQAAPVPVFTTMDLPPAAGVPGGIITAGATHGREAAKLAERVLLGEKADSIPILPGSSAPVFDWPTLTDMGLKAKQFPADTQFLNTPPPFWTRYQTELLVLGGGLFTLFASLLIYLQISRLKSRTEQAVFRALPVRVVVADENDRIYYFRSGENFDHLGVGNDPHEGFRPELVELFRQTLREVLETGEIQTREYELQGRRHKAIFRRLPTELFGVPTVLRVSSDVHDLYLARREAQEAEEQLRITLQSIGDGVIATDCSETVTMVNPVAASLTGYSPDELVGRKLDDVFHIISYLNRKRVSSPVSRALASGKIVELANHTDLIAKDGTCRHIADSAAPIRDHSGRITGAVLVFRDVTEEYRKRDTLQMQNSILNTALQIAEMTYFHCGSDGNPKGTFQTGRFWPRENGVPLLPERWLTAEYVSGFYQGWERLLSGETDEIHLEYSSDYSGKRRYFEMRVKSELLPDGKAEREYFGIIREITSGRRNELAYQNTDLLLRTLVDNLPAYVAVMDVSNDFRYIIWNRAVEELSGIPTIRAIGRNDAELEREPDRLSSNRQMREQACRAGTLALQEEYRCPNGEIRILKTFFSLIRRTQDTPLLLRLSVDMTAERRLDEERRRLNEELKIYLEQQEVINNCLERLLLQAGSSSVRAILEIIGRRTGADRCYLCEYDEAGNPGSVTCDWSHKEVAAVPPPLHNFSADCQSGWREEFNAHRLIYSSNLNLSDQPETLREIRKTLLDQGVQSIMLSGVRFQRRLWGFIGFDFIRKECRFSNIEKNIITAAAHIIEIYLEHESNKQQLRKSEYERQQIFDNINTPILLFDPNLNLIRANRAAYSAYQAVENSSDLPCYRIFCKQPQVPDYCPVRRTIETLQPQQRQVCVAGHDYMILTKPLFDSNGKFTYVLENAVEITQLNQRQKKLTEAMEAAQAADRAKSYFLATMSHELRTPLNAVIGFSELLQSGPMPDQEQQNALRAINVAGATLLELINDILDLSKLEAGKMDIIPELLDPQEFLQTVSAIFTHTARTRKLSLTVTVPPAMPHLKFDRKRLRQVLVNLLGNAFKFTEKGGVLLEAAFETVNDHFGTLILKVSDTGIGMSPETVRQLFDPFRQHHTRDYEGTGLGLAISQRLVARMGGSIEVTSEPGDGSTFRIVLPGVEYRRNQAVPASLPEPEKNLPVLSAKVLLVDDVVMNLKVLGAMLDKLHVPYLGCTSGPQALELAAREKPCMILTDLWMPDMNGDELVDKLKQLPATAGIPVIAVTADIQLTPKLNRNFAGILYKPVTMDKLRQALQFASDGVPFAENTRGRLREQETKDETMTT